MVVCIAQYQEDQQNDSMLPGRGIPLAGMPLDIRDQLPNYHPSLKTTAHAMTTTSGQSQTERKETKRGGSSNQKEKSTRSMASEADQDTQEEASRLADRAKNRLADQAERQKAQASDQLDDISEALHEASGTLHERDKDSIASLTEGAAHQIEQLSHYLRDRSVNEMLSGAKRFARRQPSIFLGGAAVLGFFGSRFFRSSEPDHHSPQHGRRHRHDKRDGRRERRYERADNR